MNMRGVAMANGKKHTWKGRSVSDRLRASTILKGFVVDDAAFQTQSAPGMRDQWATACAPPPFSKGLSWMTRRFRLKSAPGRGDR